ncbi:MAG: hypothetical protein HDR25_04870 [Lachnospiraceae bacterium]|nr:hypothetical protein [Lachnospiraceae bacterium]
MLLFEENLQQSKNRIALLEQQRRNELKKERDAKKKKDQRRNYIIGELFTKYFPEVLSLEPGNQAQNTVIFEPVEAFLSALAEIKNAAINNNATITKTTDYPKPKSTDV